MLQKIKQLREETGLSLAALTKALKSAKGDIVRAKEILREEGHKKFTSLSRNTNAGVIGSYLHHNKQLASMVVVKCETDFAQNKEFQEFANNMAIHVASIKPRWISSEDVPTEILEKEQEIIFAREEKLKRPEKIIKERIIPGALKSFYKDNCLLEQNFVKDNKPIKDMLSELSAKMGEYIKIERIVLIEV